MQRLEASPSVARWQTELAQGDALRERAKSERVPDVTLGAGPRRLRVRSSYWPPQLGLVIRLRKEARGPEHDTWQAARPEEQLTKILGRFLRRWLQADIDAGARLLSVDGFGGAGKTHLARRLGGILTTSVIHLDDFLGRGRSNLLGYLDVERLREALRAVSEHPIIVEGVCIQAALTLAQYSVDRTIYVMKQQCGQWTDGIHVPWDLSVAELTGQHSMDEAVARRIPSWPPRVFEAGDAVPLATEVGIYHYDYRPHDAADYDFLRDAVRGLGQDLARSGGSTGTSRL